MRNLLPDDPADWSDDQISFAQMWDSVFYSEIPIALAAKARRDAGEPESPYDDTGEGDVDADTSGSAADYPQDDSQTSNPSADLADVVIEQHGPWGDEYDHMKLAELKAEAHARRLELSDDADGRTKQPWIDMLRADDSSYVDLPDSHGDR